MVYPEPSNEPTDPELLAAGTVVGEHVLDGVLGAGGFARVYRAHHPVLSSQVAIKVLTRALALDAEAARRFVREAVSASRIEHPGVVKVLGYGTIPDGRTYQVMELVDGPSLDEHLDQVGRLTVDEALRLLAGIADALDAAHRAGIVHRDLKPANILLAPGADGPLPRLADFGIAKALEAEESPHLTRTGTTLGTPSYMSPEQALGRRIGPSSDVYSFGVVAFELLTGEVPYTGDSPLETMMFHVQAPVPLASSVAPELGTRFDDALTWILAKRPDDRPATPAEAFAALRAEGLPMPARRRGLRRAGLGLAAAVVLVLGAAASFLLLRDDGALPPAAGTPPTAPPPADTPPTAPPPARAHIPPATASPVPDAGLAAGAPADGGGLGAGESSAAKRSRSDRDVAGARAQTKTAADAASAARERAPGPSPEREPDDPDSLEIPADYEP